MTDPPSPTSQAQEARDANRRRVLEDFGAGKAEIDQLFAALPTPATLTSDPVLEEQSQLSAWSGYAAAARQRGVWAELSSRLVQLRFPIEADISATPAYRAATRRGQWPATTKLIWQDPDSARLEIHDSIAGPVPVLTIGCRADFVTAVRALAFRNEPVEVAPTMGACIVRGLVNWDRVERHRRQWSAAQPAGRDQEQAWQIEFRSLAQRKELYQDQLILLSEGPYSAVGADELKIDTGAWLEQSLVIRREHECTHHLLLRLTGKMSHHLWEEVVADFAGLRAAYDRYRPNMALRFLTDGSGRKLSEGPGRARLYRGKPAVDDRAFEVLCRVVEQSLPSIADWDANADATPRSDQPKMLRERALILASLTPEEVVDGELDRGTQSSSK